MISTLVSMYFGSPRLEYTIKINCIKLQTFDVEIWSILIFSKMCGTNLSTTFFNDFSTTVCFTLYPIN